MLVSALPDQVRKASVYFFFLSPLNRIFVTVKPNTVKGYLSDEVVAK